MKKYVLTTTLCLACLAVAMTSSRLAAEEREGTPSRYAITDVGTLGGTFSGPGGINDKGWATGSSTLPGDTEERAFIWRGGALTELGTLGGPNSSASTGGTPNINARGTIVGFAETSDPDPLGEDFFCGFGTGLVCLPFVWEHGLMTALPTLGGNNGFADSINNHGVATGLAENAVHDPTCVPPQVLQFKPVYWVAGQVHELTPLAGDTSGEAEAINDRGQIVGASFPDCSAPAAHAVLWQNGTPTDLGTLGGTFGSGVAINNRGEIVGGSNLSGDLVGHAFLWTRNGGMQDLGTLPGDAISLAIGVNDRTQVVGLSCDANDNCRAFLWQNGKMRDLNQLVSGKSPLLLSIAYDINSVGQIFGLGVTSNGDEHAFLAAQCDVSTTQSEDCKAEADTEITSAEATPEVKLPLPARAQRLLKGPALSHMMAKQLKNGAASLDVPTPPSSDQQWHDRIAITDRAEISKSLGLGASPNLTCPMFACGRSHYAGQLCTGGGNACGSYCPFPHHGLPLSGYDPNRHRSCWYCICT